MEKRKILTVTVGTIDQFEVPKDARFLFHRVIPQNGYYLERYILFFELKNSEKIGIIKKIKKILWP